MYFVASYAEIFLPIPSNPKSLPSFDISISTSISICDCEWYMQSNIVTSEMEDAVRKVVNPVIPYLL